MDKTTGNISASCARIQSFNGLEECLSINRDSSTVFLLAVQSSLFLKTCVEVASCNVSLCYSQVAARLVGQGSRLHRNAFVLLRCSGRWVRIIGIFVRSPNGDDMPIPAACLTQTRKFACRSSKQRITITDHCIASSTVCTYTRLPHQIGRLDSEHR